MNFIRFYSPYFIVESTVVESNKITQFVYNEGFPLQFNRPITYVLISLLNIFRLSLKNGVQMYNFIFVLANKTPYYLDFIWYVLFLSTLTIVFLMPRTINQQIPQMSWIVF